MGSRVIHAKHTQNRQNPYAPVIDRAILLLFACVMAWYYYGGGAVRLIIFTAMAALAADVVASLVLKAAYKPDNMPFDLVSSALAGAITALVMPASIAPYLPAIVIFVCVILVRAIYPILTKKPTIYRADGLSAALLAIAVLTVVFSGAAFDYPVPDAAAGAASPAVTDSVLKILQNSDAAAALRLGYVDLLTGNTAGPMGSTCLLLMLTALLYRLLRRPAEAVLPLAYTLTVGIFALFVRRAGLSAGGSLLFELSGGCGLFLMIFVLSEARYQPKNPVLAGLCGVIAGLLTMLLRYVPILEDSACLAALAVNVFSEILNRSALLKKPKKGAAGRRKWITPEEQERYIDDIASERGEGGR